MKDIKPADIIQWQNVMIGIKNSGVHKGYAAETEGEYLEYERNYWREYLEQKRARVKTEAG